MRKIVIDVLLGFAFVVAVMLLQLAASFAIDAFPNVDPDQPETMANLLFLAVSLPAGALALLAARMRKTETLAAAAYRAGLWSGIQLLAYVGIGLANGTADVIFGGYGFYVMLLLMTAGPLINPLLKKHHATRGPVA